MMRAPASILSFLTVATLGLTSPARGEPPILQLHKDKGVVAHPGIDPLYQRFSKAYSDLDEGAAAGVYSDDAVYLIPGEEVRRGSAAIREAFATQFGKARQEGRHLFLRFGVIQRRIEGGLAYDVGYANLSVSGKDSYYTQSFIKFVVVSRKQSDGSWRWQVDSYSGLYTLKPGATTVDLEKNIGATITLRGTARNAKGGAVLLTSTGEPIYVRGLESWPTQLEGKAVELSGTLKKEKYLPSATVSKDGAVSQGAEGMQFTVDNPSFKPASP